MLNTDDESKIIQMEGVKNHRQHDFTVLSIKKKSPCHAAHDPKISTVC